MKWLISLAMLGIVAFSSAQTLDEYLSLRKKHAIVRAVSMTDLDALMGSKVIEIAGKVYGVMELDGKTSISVQCAGNSVVVIDASSVPDWLKGGQIDARILVKASRTEQFGALTADFMGAAIEAEVSRFEAPPVKATSGKTSSGKSSSGSPIRGDITSRGTKRGGSTSSPPSSGSKPTVYSGEKIVQIYASFIKNHNKRLSVNQAYEIGEAVIGWSRKFNVDARLVMALLIAESDFNPKDISHTGAMGLGQLMPETARELGVRNPWNTNENLYGVVKLLRQHIDRYGAGEDNWNRLALALAAYNAGPGAVKKHGGVPPYRETQNYVRKVIRIFRELRGY
jgi:hypothetical protein